MKNDRFFLGMAAGAVLGGLIAAALTAAGQTGTQTGQKPPVPTDELRRFAEVFGSVKTNYVEPVDDRKAIRGVLSHAPIRCVCATHKTCATFACSEG